MHSALTNAAGVVARYDGYPEAAALVARPRSIYETAQTAPGAFADLYSIDQVLANAKEAWDKDTSEPTSARDRIRDNFAAERDGVEPASKSEMSDRMLAAFQQGVAERQDRAERGASTIDVVHTRTADRVRDINLARDTAGRLADTIPHVVLGEPDHDRISGREAADLETMSRLAGKWAGNDPSIEDRVVLIDRMLSETESRPSISDVDVASYSAFDRRGWESWHDVERKELLNNVSEQQVLLQSFAGQQQQSASFPRSAAAELNASVGQAQSAATFRSGRGFGAPAKDAGVER